MFPAPKAAAGALNTARRMILDIRNVGEGILDAIVARPLDCSKRQGLYAVRWMSEVV